MDRKQQLNHRGINSRRHITHIQLIQNQYKAKMTKKNQLSVSVRLKNLVSVSV